MNDNKWDDIEVFDVKNDYQKIKIFISISKKTPSFNLSTGFMNIAKKQLDNLNYVILLFSPKSRIIGFKFIEKSVEEKELRIVSPIMCKHGTIRSKQFFNYYSIDLEEVNGKYEPTLENIPDHGEVWTINLNEKKVL
jgi:hypothetical protein